MKRWNSAILALALLAASDFVPAQAETVRETAIAGTSCCCCSSEKAHSKTGSCSCDGCAQKNTPHCGCVQTAPSLTALLSDSGSSFSISLCGGVVVLSTRAVIRPDPPLLRPPIFS